MITSCGDEEDERKRTTDDASKSIDDIETGEPPGPGKSMAGTYLLVMRCPVYRWRESHPGFRTELENLAGDGKGKSPSGRTVRLKVPMRQPGADCSVIAEKRGNSRGERPTRPRI